VLFRSKSYISKSDPKGWLPGAVIKTVSSQVPLCVAGVFSYLEKYGAPPYVARLAGKVIKGTFDHDTSAYSLTFESKPSDWCPSSRLFFSSKRYPSGFDITIEPNLETTMEWDPSQVYSSSFSAFQISLLSIP